MQTILDSDPDRCHRELPETRPRMAKADLRKPETDEWRTRVGSVIQRVISLSGWNLKRFAIEVGRDERQCSRWLTGAERAQIDAVLAVKELRPLLVIAIAELAGEAVDVTTVVTLRRSA